MLSKTFARTATVAVIAALFCGSGSAAEEVQTWDGLTRAKSKRVDAVFLLQGADISDYHAIIIEPVEVAFKEDYQKDYNRDQRDPSRTVKDEDVQKARAEVAKVLPEIFAKHFEKGGWTIAHGAQPGALALRSAVIDIYVSAPDTQSAGRSRTYSWDAGSATLVLEVRDSLSRQLLGRAVDARATSGGSTMQWTTSVSNRADFKMMFDQWARMLVDGLNDLKEGKQPKPMVTKKKD
jgi:hypothetical protein